MTAATMAPMTKRHERPDVPEGYLPGRAIRRALLRALLEFTEPAGLIRLSEATGEPRSTVRRHAVRLVRKGLTEQTGLGYVLTDAGREAAHLLLDCKE